MKAAQSPELKKAIETHIAQSERQVVRLKKVAEMGGFKPTGKVCKAAQGLVEEANEHLEEGARGATLDAAIIACAQKDEHYEICSYGTVIAGAETLGSGIAVSLLQKTLAEEEAADELLTGIAGPVNSTALDGWDNDGMRKLNSKAASGTKSSSSERRNGDSRPRLTSRFSLRNCLGPVVSVDQ